MINKNEVVILGEVVTTPVFSHTTFGESFYTFDVLTKRTSGNNDVIPVTLSERIIKPEVITLNTFIKVTGRFQSFNQHYTCEGATKTKLLLFVFALDVILASDDSYGPDTNTIDIDGYVCKTPVYRKTPLGREITDLLIAVNRPYGNADYFPCVVWGRNARFASTLNTGDKVSLSGRIQSREYQKKIGEEQFESKIAYEISVGSIVKLENDL